MRVDRQAWAYALLVLVCLGGIGLILYAVVLTTISQRASGHLPLTHSARRQVEMAIWVPAGLIIAWVVLWIVAIAVPAAATCRDLGWPRCFSFSACCH